MAGGARRAPTKRDQLAEKGVTGVFASLLNGVPDEWTLRERLLLFPGPGQLLGRTPPPPRIRDEWLRRFAQALRTTPAAPQPGVGSVLAGTRAVPRSRLVIPKGTDQTLLDVFRRHGWAGVYVVIDERPRIRRLSKSRSEMTWRVAAAEARAFDRAGFDIAWCRHGGHWYVRPDRRQKECLHHQMAGQQARWRRKHRQKQRRTAARRATVA